MVTLREFLFERGALVKFTWDDNVNISTSKRVKVKKMNHIIEITDVAKKTKGNIRKLDADTYVNLNTGEVLEYQANENRGQNADGLKKTFRKIRDLINNNFVGAASELHVTLTYAENMTDTKRLYEDFDKFYKKLKYHYGNVFEYLSIVEPQGRGAWHHHVLLKRTDGLDLFIPHDKLTKLWGHGFTWIKSLQNVDNIGAYLSAYLGDVELDPEKIENLDELMQGTSLEIVEKNVDGIDKKFVKGARCSLYPVGMKICRPSRGIKHPEPEEMTYEEIKEEIKRVVGCARPNYSKALTITDDSNNVVNVIRYENYNLKRL